MMSAVMTIALICGSRFPEHNYSSYASGASKCQDKLIECYEAEKGDLDTRLIKCIRKGN